MCGVDEVRAKYERLRRVMDERVTRLWAAAEAEAFGYGGVAAVRHATGISESRIRAGLRDLAEQAAHPPTAPPRAQRVRRVGAGRPPLTETDPTLVGDLESLVDPVTRGDPESPLRWTCKSKDKLAAELRERGHKVSCLLYTSHRRARRSSPGHRTEDLVRLPFGPRLSVPGACLDCPRDASSG